MEPQRLIAQPMYTDDHCRRYVGLLEQPAPLRDSLAATREDDCVGRIRRNVHTAYTLIAASCDTRGGRRCIRAGRRADSLDSSFPLVDRGADADLPRLALGLTRPARDRVRGGALLI